MVELKPLYSKTEYSIISSTSNKNALSFLMTQGVSKFKVRVYPNLPSGIINYHPLQKGAFLYTSVFNNIKDMPFLAFFDGSNENKKFG